MESERNRQGVSPAAIACAVFSAVMLHVAAVMFALFAVVAPQVDYVHDDGAAVALLAPLCEGHKDGYPYHYTDPGYFASRAWESEPWHGDTRGGVKSANEDGSLGLCQPQWYVAHSDSGYGQEILSMVPGDPVEVDGKRYRITGTGTAYAGGTHLTGEVIALTGNADLILQTCSEGGYGPDGAKELFVAWGDEVT